MSRTGAFAVLAMAVLLAGCGDKGGPREIEVAPGQVVEVTEPPKPTHGTVAGLVGNDALYPLPGVAIRIIGTAFNATTDEDGRFAIVNVPPGIYIVEGWKKDHKVVQTTVDVQAGQVAKAILLLERIPTTDPYHITWSQDAFTQFAAGGVSSTRNATLAFTLDPSRPDTIVLESRWDGTILSADDRFLEYRLWLLDGKDITNDVAGNPFSLHLDARVLPPGAPELRFTAAPDPLQAVVFQSRGTLYATVFYNAPAPAGWSLLAGDT